MKETQKKILFILLAGLTFWPRITSSTGLILGILFALVVKNPFSHAAKRWTTWLLQLSVIGLGAQMDLFQVAQVGMEGVGYTLVSIGATLLLGAGLAAWLKTERETSLLVTVGTAICGGSAIAAVAPAIRARPESVSLALACVFLLNSIALLLFPPLGHMLHLSQSQFGLWSALAIHDTSSVVGASSEFGKEALQIATTIKLARALWIIPLTFILGQLYGKKAGAKKPWFILGFLAMAALVTFFPVLQPVGETVAFVARRFLVLTLFLIGSSLSREAIRNVGWKPLVLGVVLWIAVLTSTLGWICMRDY